jgi:hypothetical protein
MTKKRNFNPILLCFLFSAISISFISGKIINITNRWNSRICPVHNEKLSRGLVDCVVGGRGGQQPDGSNDYKNPPYDFGEYPNAKFKFYSSPGCILFHEKAIILYCKKCELKKNGIFNAWN